MNLEKVFIDFNGNFSYLDKIKLDLINFPSDTFSPHEKSEEIIKLEVKDEKESIIISPYAEGNVLSIHVPEGATNVIIDHTNRTTNFEYNKRKYYIFSEKR
jgi:hypothetical protein